MRWRRQDVAVEELALVDREGEAGDVRLADDGGDEEGQQVLDQGTDDDVEGDADDHGDGPLDDIAANDEVPESFELSDLPRSAA